MRKWTIYTRIIVLVFTFVSYGTFIPYDYDVVVIGGGITGLCAARVASQYKKKVALVESKALMDTYLSEQVSIWILRNISSLNAQLSDINLTTKIHPQTVLSKIRSIVADIKKRPLSMFNTAGFVVLHGTASFVNEHTLMVGSTPITTHKTIIATGITKKPMPTISGLQAEHCLDIHSLFQEETLPLSIIIIGCDEQAIEIAALLSALGVSVILLVKYGLFLPGFDYEMVEHVSHYIHSLGVQIYVDTIVESIDYQHEQVAVSCINGHGQKNIHYAQKLCISRGVMPNIADLNGEVVGLHCTHEGIVVDNTLKTSVGDIYACGSVLRNGNCFSSSCMQQASIAAYNACASYWSRAKQYDTSSVIRVVNTPMPFTSIGLTEQEAIRRFGLSLSIYRVPYGEIEQSYIDNATKGFGKFICDEYGNLVGAHIFGASSQHLIHMLTVGKPFKKQYEHCGTNEYLFPSYQELIWHAIDQHKQSHISHNYFFHDVW